ncbi:hypothetical protein F6R98_01695 [Candidatus Methylospira mobilis]|uniref:Alginate export domain-containing protein n=1 Tax=Candidatus Methylospira mobilis TaxID=1808979 RepID=A0A5Q0BH49_9GAMM|nr:alginate export family protein [Candidatus Methylospira mobilis]QFY41494.1 hypothetical protein F6R98_01695 [Candidatus Methylospira mobilis]WNV05277.1 alginate export family protein [Candidatus Methylospira mobilis]
MKVFKQKRCFVFTLAGSLVLFLGSGFADTVEPNAESVANFQYIANEAKTPANRCNSGKPADIGCAGKSIKQNPKEPATQEHQYRPRQTLGAVASLRKDELTGMAHWDDAQDWSLQKMLRLPSWISLTLEERVRYENYNTPWIKGDMTGQYQVPIQSVLWAEARFTETFRAGVEFWDARQYGPSNPDRLSSAMSNAGNFAQIYAAWIGRDIFQSGLDSEIKGGRMTMDVASRRLIARFRFGNTVYQFAGLQARLHDDKNGWELLAFANVPEQLLPTGAGQLLHNDLVWNRPQTDAYFTGALLTKKFPAQISAELYLYYLHEGRNDTYSSLNRSLYTPGFRVKRHPGKGEVDFEIESIGQAGSARISATAPVLDIGSVYQHVESGYTFDMPWSPRLVAQWDYASSHFDPLFGTPIFDYGPTGILTLFNRTNINTPGYRLFLTPHRDFSLVAANRYWWLADNKSSTGWSQANLVDTTGSSGSYVGQTWELNGRWDAFDNLAFQVGWQILMKGGFAKEAPGAPANQNHVNYYFVQTELRF